MLSQDESIFKYKAKMREIIPKIKDLPTLPSVVTKIIEMTEDLKSSAEDIAKVIAMDQALTAKVLRISNSAYYGFGQRISSLDRAVVALGFKIVKNLALSISAFEAFPTSYEEGDFDRRKFWEHAVGCAVISKLLAKRTGYPHARLEEVFTAGLLHDIGKVVLDRYFHDEFCSAVRMAVKENIPIIEAEDKVLGINHTEIGHRLAFTWKLPEELQWVIFSHHNPEFALKDARRLVGIVHIGDILCRRKGMGSGGDNVIPPMNENILEIVGLDPNDIEAIMDLIDDEMKKAEAFLPMDT
jgi:putative nucleotidyltransferase with HDIG domain